MNSKICFQVVLDPAKSFNEAYRNVTKLSGRKICFVSLGKMWTVWNPSSFPDILWLGNIGVKPFRTMGYLYIIYICMISCYYLYRTGCCTAPFLVRSGDETFRTYQNRPTATMKWIHGIYNKHVWRNEQCLGHNSMMYQGPKRAISGNMLQSTTPRLWLQ